MKKLLYIMFLSLFLTSCYKSEVIKENEYDCTFSEKINDDMIQVLANPDGTSQITTIYDDDYIYKCEESYCTFEKYQGLNTKIIKQIINNKGVDNGFFKFKDYESSKIILKDNNNDSKGINCKIEKFAR